MLQRRPGQPVQQRRDNDERGPPQLAAAAGRDFAFRTPEAKATYAAQHNAELRELELRVNWSRFLGNLSKLFLIINGSRYTSPSLLRPAPSKLPPLSTPMTNNRPTPLRPSPVSCFGPLCWADDQEGGLAGQVSQRGHAERMMQCSAPGPGHALSSALSCLCLATRRQARPGHAAAAAAQSSRVRARISATSPRINR
ncbi:hypothetical protein CPLU01_00460 [Colletotrichum plurivorum]|uniref:Uncharacterized protein n=1 Tax=Colletotrichum plurivorum TaxID=2175906 RepID=A0A8H6NRX4_9PEZI|nr:hypothetical protein CPLU01_00460 [Colletotrichum plurivorum]